MSNEMPGMPVMEENDKPSGEQVNEVSPEQDQDSLTTPSHEDVNEDKPILVSPDEEIVSNVKTPIVPKGGIEVIASRPGFFGQHRKKKGESFKIKSYKQFGSWFNCVDPVHEKARVKFYKDKKANR